MRDHAINDAGALFLMPCVRFAFQPARDRAREVFLASLLYLPAVYLLMIIDKS